MVTFSVFTPLSSSGNDYVEEAYKSLLSQTFGDWEWLLMPNAGGLVPKAVRDDPRVRILLAGNARGIGALKGACCAQAAGAYLFELDHDDVLHRDALLKAGAAFDCGADFVYSDFAEYKEDAGIVTASWKGYPYGAAYGWSHYETLFKGQRALAMRGPPPTPQNIRKIEFAPNHLRAWRRSFYESIGGHSEGLPVADDHDLVLRTFLAGGKIVHIPECLYFYRVHGAQATNANNKNQLIQELDWRVYEAHVESVALKFARDAGLESIDLCGGINPRGGYRPLDISLGHNLNGAWPLGDSSVGALRASDAIEHLRDPVHTMNEAWRVLAPGGFFFIMVPSTDGRGAFQDPTHVSFWNANSFWYYTSQGLQKYVPAIEARFQVARIRDVVPSDWHRLHNIPYVEAQLIALKPGYEPMGEVLWASRDGVIK